MKPCVPSFPLNPKEPALKKTTWAKMVVLSIPLASSQKHAQIRRGCGPRILITCGGYACLQCVSTVRPPEIDIYIYIYIYIYMYIFIWACLHEIVKCVCRAIRMILKSLLQRTRLIGQIAPRARSVLCARGREPYRRRAPWLLLRCLLRPRRRWSARRRPTSSSGTRSSETPCRCCGVSARPSVCVTASSRQRELRQRTAPSALLLSGFWPSAWTRRWSARPCSCRLPPLESASR